MLFCYGFNTVPIAGSCLHIIHIILRLSLPNINVKHLIKLLQGGILDGACLNDPRTVDLQMKEQMNMLFVTSKYPTGKKINNCLFNAGH